MTTLFLIRHGNTFDKGDTLLRVGARTDLPLSQSGISQIQHLAQHFKSQALTFDAIYSGPLLRHRQTADILVRDMATDQCVQVQSSFNEVDYGVDDGQPEVEVEQRLGKEALDAWNQHGQVPSGWNIDVALLKKAWHNFAADCRTRYPEGRVMLVTSGGTLRFAQDLLNDVAAAQARYGTKVSTAAYCVLTFPAEQQQWQIETWNHRA